MIINAKALAPATIADRVFDVCVVGTGPAGLSLARSLARQGKTVALMNGGDRDITPNRRRSTRAGSSAPTTGH